MPGRVGASRAGHFSLGVTPRPTLECSSSSWERGADALGESCRPSTRAPPQQVGRMPPSLARLCFWVSEPRSGTRPRCSCLRVAEVLALKEAAAQQGQGLPFRVSDPCATLRGRRTPALWDPVSLVRGSGTSCPLSSGWLRKVLLLVAPGAQPLAPPAHCTAGVMNLCPAAGALGTQDPFLKGQGRETCPWGAAYRADDEPAQGHSSSSQ